VRSARFDPSGALRGELRPPPDKSISHRAAILAAMADGESEIEGYLDAADTRSTLRAVEQLGAGIEEGVPAAFGAGRRNSRRGSPNGGLDLRIRGVGLRGPRGSAEAGGPLEIDVGNAGTLLRILPGWLAGQERGFWVLSGDASISSRPVDRVVDPLSLMGGDLTARDDRLPPLAVSAAPLRGIEYRLPVASAQVKSCLLLAGVLAEGTTEVVEPAPTRDHTERMLRAMGVPVEVEDLRTVVGVGGPPARRIRVAGPVERLEPVEVAVPGDLSSAAFFVVAAVLVPGSRVRIEGVGLNPTRLGLLGILNRMGAALEVEEGVPVAGEPRGAIVARHGPLNATRVQPEEVPLAIDELPLVALAACFAEGETVVRGAGELRHKESDRIAVVVEGLTALGAEVDALEDGFAVRGGGGLRGGALDAVGDHRMAMLGAVAGLASGGGVEVRGMDAAAVSYPGFQTDLQSLLAR
jgi:3-phosphoshikimate 1-carboxyvinyltransferase